MQPGSNQGGRLDGWKEIGRYFGRSVRTVQDWEREGLPIHRLRKRVWAFEPELAAWQARYEDRGSLTEAEVTPGAAEPAATSRLVAIRNRWRWLLAVVAVPAVAVGTVFVWRFARERPNPIRLVIEGTLLKTYDARNRLVWEYPLPEVPLGSYGREPLSYYQPHVFGDIDGDGRNELLFAYRPGSVEENGTTVYCFSPDGRVAWTAKPGRTLKTRSGMTLGNNYSTSNLALLSKNGPDGARIVALSHHAWSWASQVLLLNTQGKQVGEYWHPGWLLKLAVADLDGDGRDEIIAGGVNSSYTYAPEADSGATLVILDSRKVSGQGPTRPEEPPRIPGIERAQEAAVLLFPAPIKSPRPHSYYRVHGLRVVGRSLEIEVRITEEQTGDPYVIYQLDNRLNITGIQPNVALQQVAFPGLYGVAFREAVSRQLGRVKVLRNAFAR